MDDFTDQHDEPLWRKRRDFMTNEAKIEGLKTELQILEAADSGNSPSAGAPTPGASNGAGG